MVAFDLPRTVTASGIALLLGIVAVLIGTIVTTSERPGLLVVYVITLTVVLAASAAAMLLPARSTGGWLLGSAGAAFFVVTYAGSRFVAPAGAPQAQAGWDYAPGTAALGFGLLFLALHASVLLGVNVAHPRSQGWHD